MDSAEALDENIKVDVVQLKPSDGAGECLWNYTELPSVVVAVLPMKEVAESTAEEQDSLALKSFCDTSKFQNEYSPAAGAAGEAAAEGSGCAGIPLALGLLAGCTRVVAPARWCGWWFWDGRQWSGSLPA
ncbi:Protein of unknown function [Gryllus bimaculatus]|nr:Protein of unknown function [Gryllus bimaculatus]